ncbi:MAG: type II secretion system F family protein, partial [Candidatus Omnitrophica bacterium]|nr:type II secretion system F family protein [Candidatus Omnitrophota bacterium]
MTTFAYAVKDKQGQTHHGTLDADSRQALIEQLWKQDLVVLSIGERQRHRITMMVGQPRVGSQLLAVFSRQLATMFASGIPLVGALDVLAEQIDEPGFRKILKRIRDDVEAGSGLSASLAKHPSVFSEFFVNMVKAGESSGRLDEILDRLAAYLEKSDALLRKVRASLFYPVVVSCLATLITAFLVIWVVPKFKEIFTTLGGELPLPTRLLLQTSELLRRYFVAEIALILASLAGFHTYINTNTGRLWLDRTKLRLPVIGSLLQKVAVARFARTLATLVGAGVPILASFEIVAKTAGNKVVENAVIVARASIQKGESIAEPLADSKVFPPMLTRMIAVGEKTGELEKMLSKLADFYDNEVDAVITGLTSLIEPLIIAVLGVVIGGIVIALF